MTDVPSLPAASATRDLRRSVPALIVRNPLALIGLVLLCVMLLVALFAGVLAPHDPLDPTLQLRNAPPGTPDHLLGADGSGRDILSRLLHGSRLTLLGAALAVVVATVVGVPAGLVAGYTGGAVDAVASWVSDVLLSVPGKVVLLAVIAAFGPSVTITMSAFGVILSPHLYRLVRAQAIGVKRDLYVDAARVSGLSATRIVARHVLPVVQAPVIIQTASLAGIAIIVQSGLEFLGFGSPDQVTWGSMLGNAFSVIYLAPTAMVWPGIAIGVTVASLVLLGNGLRDAVQGTSARRPARRGRGRPSPTPAGRGRATRGTVVGAAAGAAGADDAATPVLEVRGLRVGYPGADGEVSVVVDGVDLTVRRGEVLGLVGESGSGKTQTALRRPRACCRAVARSLDGSVRRGRGRRASPCPSASAVACAAAPSAYVPQEPLSNLDPAFRIGQQLVEP